jgi:hypothetical protein
VANVRDSLLAQLEALAQQALLMAAQVGALTKMVEVCWPEQPEPEPEEIDGRCLHPAQYRVPAATAGQPSRYACRRCRQTGGLITTSTQESNGG